MRTYFQPEDTDAYDAAKDLLTRRCTAWAKDRGQQVDPFALAAALDFRHHGIDGRLGYWTTGLVEEFLLSHAPRALSISAEDAAGLPESLRVLVSYLHATGLADPTGDALADLDAAITKSSAEFRTAMADERNFGVAKFWLLTATRHGVDPTDSPAMHRFLDDARNGRIDYDEDVLAHIAARHVSEDGSQPVRAVTQLPVFLPPESDLAVTAEHTQVVTRLRALTDWVGDGKPLTTTGNVKLADARELVALLDTGDTFDPLIGDQVFRTKSSVELPGLMFVIELAKQIRLVRVVKNRLVRVAKAQPLLRDGLALWTAAFDALPTPDFLLSPGAWGAEYTRMLDTLLDDMLPDILNTVYGLPEPIPVIRLAESVWFACTEAFYLGELDPATTARWREGIAADVRRMLTILAELGAVELTVDRPDPLYLADLALAGELEPDVTDVLPPDARDRLVASLGADAGQVELVTLTPLATRAVRARLRHEGRHAPLVGELSGAEPAQLLGTISEHYSEETAAAEIAGWLATHGGWEGGLPRLLDGVRDCPFRTRAAAMLAVLAANVPDRSTFLGGLRADRQLGPIATQMLAEDGELSMDELTPEEALRAMAEQFIHLLELGGFDAVADALAQVPGGQGREMAAALLESGHPDRAGLDELRTLVHTRFSGRPGHATVHPLSGATRSGRARGKNKRRR